MSLSAEAHNVCIRFETELEFFISNQTHAPKSPKYSKGRLSGLIVSYRSVSMEIAMSGSRLQQVLELNLSQVQCTLNFWMDRHDRLFVASIRRVLGYALIVFLSVCL